MHRFGYELRKWRKARGYSLERAGALVHVSGALLQRIEIGERRPLRDLAIRCDQAFKAGGALVEAWDAFSEAETQRRLNEYEVQIPLGRVEASNENLAVVAIPRQKPPITLAHPIADGSALDQAMRPLFEMPADTFDLIQLAEAIGRNGGNVKRRELLSIATVLGTTAAIANTGVWERIAYAITNPRAVDERTVAEIEARTLGFHHLEEMVSAPALLKGLTLHLREIGILLSGTVSDPSDSLRTRLLVTVGESAVLAGWIASDAGNSAVARNWYATAVKAAKEAHDPELAACALGYRSYIPSTRGLNWRARALLAEALELLPSRGVSVGTIAWLSARHAEESAQLGDIGQANTSWVRAEEAYRLADPDEDRVWIRFLDQNRFDSFRIATYSRIGRLEEAQEITESVLSRLDWPDRKKAVIIFEDMARANIATGTPDEGAAMAMAGLGVLRETEFAMWLPRYERIANTLEQHKSRSAVRTFLSEFSDARHHFASRL